MKSTIEKLSSNKVRIDFTVEPELFEKGMQAAYRKNVGRDLEVVTTDGERAEGTLEDASDDGIVIRTPGTKKQPAETLRFAYRDIKAARVAIKF